MTLLAALLRPLAVVLPVLGWALLFLSELGPPLWQPRRPEPRASAKLMALPGSLLPMRQLASRCAVERSGPRPPNQERKCSAHPLRHCR